MTKNTKIILIMAVVAIAAGVVTYSVKKNTKALSNKEAECNISLYTQDEPCVKEYREKIKAGLMGTTFTVQLSYEEPTFVQATLNEKNEEYIIGEFNNKDIRGDLVVNSDKLALFSKDIALMPIIVSEGGTGNYQSIAAFNIVDGKLKGIEALSPLGDRIDFDKIEQIGKGDKYPELGTISVRYLTHGEEQAMADKPNQPETLIVKLLIGDGGKLKFGEPIR